MTEKEYKQKKEELELEYQNKMRQLNNERVASMAFPIDTIVKDHIGYAKIIEYKPVLLFYKDRIEPVYYCQNLTKKKEINKREPNRYVYHSNIIEPKI